MNSRLVQKVEFHHAAWSMHDKQEIRNKKSWGQMASVCLILADRFAKDFGLKLLTKAAESDRCPLNMKTTIFCEIIVWQKRSFYSMFENDI